ncbi:MAG: hypothetical protein GYA24_04960 [Candidatus Lokiarchaeota archaeon]|nr:hypothetical protein [Candidatus Lokiarchaeota archaeon]
MIDDKTRFQKQQKAHTIGSGIWLLVFSALFVALLVYADSESLLVQEDAFLQAAIIIIVAIAILTWAATIIWFLQRGRPTLISLGHPAVKYVVAGIIISGCISFVVFILLMYQGYGNYLAGEYSWGHYVVFGVVAFFLFGGAWHLARLVKPDFLPRQARPWTRKGPRVFYVVLCASIIAGASSLFVSIAKQAADPVVPFQFTQEPGTANTSVILLIGDGMGPNQMQLGKLVEYGPGVNASFDRFPYKTTVSTANVDGGVTDSAAGATAIGTGTRTSNGRLATSTRGQNLTTILEIAKQKGYATGLIAICELTHATPAAFASHQPSRGTYPEIAADMVRSGVDVMLGGGWGVDMFGPHVANMQANGYAYATNKTQLAAMSTTPALGLFASGGMPKTQAYTDASTVPTLLEMVEKGIELLNSTGKPFFLMIEESFIDSGGHGNDPVMVAHEMIMLDKVVNHTLDFAIADGHTQVLLTADHETGGLQILGTGLMTGPLPHPSLTVAENTLRRTTRASQAQVSWSTGGHTSIKVVLAGYGPYTSQIPNARFNIDTFSLMRMAIEGVSGPVEQGVNDDNTAILLVYVAFGGMGISVVVLAVAYAKHGKTARAV